MEELFIMLREYGVLALMGFGIIVLGMIWIITGIQLKAIRKASKDIKLPSE